MELCQFEVSQGYIGSSRPVWIDGSALKRTGYSSRGPEFNSQQLHGGSQSNALFLCVAIDNKAPMYIKDINKYIFKKKMVTGQQGHCGGLTENDAPTDMCI